MKAMLEAILGASTPEMITQSMQKAARMFAQRDNAGNSTLMAAVRHSGERGGDSAVAEAASFDCCKVVLAHESGVETIDSQNNDGDTALMLAQQNGHAAVCALLEA